MRWRINERERERELKKERQVPCLKHHRKAASPLDCQLSHFWTAKKLKYRNAVFTEGQFAVSMLSFLTHPETASTASANQ